MEFKDAEQSRGDSLKSTASPQVEQTSCSLQTVLGNASVLAGGEDALILLRAELTRALNDYRLGQRETTRDTLLRAEASLQALMTCLKQMPETAPFFLLRAATWTALGRVLGTLGRLDEAKEAYLRAVDLFAKWLPHTRRATSEDYTNYGVALVKLDRVAEAAKQLQRAARGDADMETYRYLGISLHRLKHYDEAEEWLKKALQKDPDDRLVCETLGDTLKAKGRRDEAGTVYLHAAIIAASEGENGRKSALEYMDRILELGSRDPKVLVAKAELLKSLGDHEKALEAFDEALKQQRSSPVPTTQGTKDSALGVLGRARDGLHRLLGNYKEELPSSELVPIILGAKGATLITLGNYEEALKTLNQASEIKPQDAFILKNKGEVLRRLGRYKEAQEVLSEALKLEPDDATTLRCMGDVLRHGEHYTEALNALNRALRLEPRNAFALGILGSVLFMVGDYEKALEALEQALEQEPDDTFVLIHKGVTLIALSRPAEAWETLERALKLEPDNVVVLQYKGEALRQLGRYAEALEVLEAARKLGAEDAFTLGTIGQLLCVKGDFEEAARLLDHAAQLSPSEPWIYRERGWALLNLGPERAEEARRDYELVLEKEPNALGSRRNLGDVFYMLGHKNEAVAAYSRVLEQAEKRLEVDAHLLALMGWCHYRLEQYDEAERLYVEALYLDGGLVYVQFDLALTILCGGRHSLAVTEYQRGLEMAQRADDFERPGLLSVARNDLVDTLRIRHDLVDALRTQLDALRTQLERMKPEEGAKAKRTIAFLQEALDKVNEVHSG